MRQSTDYYEERWHIKRRLLDQCIANGSPEPFITERRGEEATARRLFHNALRELG